jgi:hypothetical protein
MGLVASCHSPHGETIEIVGKSYRAGVSFFDLGLSLILLAQRPQHAMRQHQAFDFGVARDLSDHGRGHVQVSFDSDGSFRYGVVSDEQIGVHCQPDQACSLAVAIAAKRENLTANLDAPS